jgi:hypothetical protein
MHFAGFAKSDSSKTSEESATNLYVFVAEVLMKIKSKKTCNNTAHRDNEVSLL